ncbi:MAG: hypothetical protein H6835_06010 [Planctomycetes bacterium]|nr:hypothetical protein [Planctomycetota bacterium]
MRFVVVYQREPHARQMAFAEVPQPLDHAERAKLAQQALDELKLDVDVWIDDEGDQSRAMFGDLPHSAIVLDPAGTVRLKLSWCDPEVLELTIPEVPRAVSGKQARPADEGFLDRLRPLAADATPIDRHHRATMLAHLVTTQPGHAERDAWIAELAHDSAPEWQRDWALRQPPTIPPGENPQAWAGDMARFAELDRSAPAPEHPVVFVGSSSIRLWSTLADDMAGLPIVQRGFGGSRLFDACYWSELLVTRHHPAAVVIFSGTNDIAGDHPKTAEQVRDLFRLFVRRVRRADPGLPIAWIAITPTLARAPHLAIVREANRLVREDCAADPLLEFVDPTADLATAEGAPDPRFFRQDHLHLNADGYAAWTRHVRPVVERLLQER